MQGKPIKIKLDHLPFNPGMDFSGAINNTPPTSMVGGDFDYFKV